MERETVKALRLLVGVPALACMLILSLDDISGKIDASWDATAFLCGLGLAIVLKGIEYFIRRYVIFWMATGGVGSFKDFENKR